MNRRARRFWLVAGFCHLLALAGSAGLVNTPTLYGLGRPVALAVELYKGFSGIFTSYGFFAPEVPPSVRVMFHLANSQGWLAEPFGLAGHNHETDIRVKDLAAEYPDIAGNEGTVQAFVASFAGKVLYQHPEATHVEVRIEVALAPELAAAARGTPISWRLAYRADVAR